jgi:methionine biosynthesis protein MetW
MAQSFLKKYYSSKVLKYKISSSRVDKIIPLISGDLKNKKILDIGCGNGDLARMLTDKEIEVYGIDISSKAVSKTKKFMTKFYELDLNEDNLPFKNQTLDIVIASEIIEHLFAPEKLLKEIHRVLKKGGLAVITTPNFLYWGNRLKFLEGWFDYEKTGIFDESHVHFFTYSSLKKEIKNSGFKIIKENHVYAGGDWLNKIKCKYPSLFAYQLVVLLSRDG